MVVAMTVMHQAVVHLILLVLGAVACLRLPLWLRFLVCEAATIFSTTTGTMPHTALIIGTLMIRISCQTLSRCCVLFLPSLS